MYKTLTIIVNTILS